MWNQHYDNQIDQWDTSLEGDSHVYRSWIDKKSGIKKWERQSYSINSAGTTDCEENKTE